jgi:hypothetical protein
MDANLFFPLLLTQYASEIIIRMMDWQSGRKYLLSGSPLMLVGSSVALLLSSLHILSYRFAFWVICVCLLGGTAQMVASRYRR